VTYTILLRSGTLLRRPDIAEDALKALALSAEITKPTEFEQSPPVLTSVSSPTEFNKGLRRLQSEVLRAQFSSENPVAIDAYAFTAYIQHLVATGRPHFVSKVLFEVLPELSIVDHPSWSTEKDSKNIRIKSRVKALQRAVTLGPWVLTTLLNALSKAGQTGLAERLWLLAKKAERASWIPDFCPEIEPWYLSIEAYTIMLQVYAVKARKRPYVQRTAKHYDNPQWAPRSPNDVHGYAQYVLQRDNVASSGRRRIGRLVAGLMHDSMKNGAGAVYDEFQRLRAANKVLGNKMKVFKPDAYFFNAALRIFGPRLASAGEERFARRDWERRLLNAESEYNRQGVLPTESNPMLVKIVTDMLEAGYSVPRWLRQYMAGTVEPRSLRRNSVIPQRGPVPFAYPSPPRLAPILRLPVRKTRGLPLQKQRRSRNRGKRRRVSIESLDWTHRLRVKFARNWWY